MGRDPGPAANAESSAQVHQAGLSAKRCLPGSSPRLSKKPAETPVPAGSESLREVCSFRSRAQQAVERMAGNRADQGAASSNGWPCRATPIAQQQFDQEYQESLLSGVFPGQQNFFSHTLVNERTIHRVLGREDCLASPAKNTRACPATAAPQDLCSRHERAATRTSRPHQHESRPAGFTNRKGPLAARRNPGLLRQQLIAAQATRRCQQVQHSPGKPAAPPPQVTGKPGGCFLQPPRIRFQLPAPRAFSFFLSCRHRPCFPGGNKHPRPGETRQVAVFWSLQALVQTLPRDPAPVYCLGLIA